MTDTPIPIPTVNPTRKDGGTANVVTITITYDPTNGQVSVHGPIANPILFLGMLKLAEKTYDTMRLRSQMEQANRLAKSTSLIHKV